MVRNVFSMCGQSWYAEIRGIHHCCVSNAAEPCVIVFYLEMYRKSLYLKVLFHYFWYYCGKRDVKCIQFCCH